MFSNPLTEPFKVAVVAVTSEVPVTTEDSVKTGVVDMEYSTSSSHEANESPMASAIIPKYIFVFINRLII